MQSSESDDPKQRSESSLLSITSLYNELYASEGEVLQLTREALNLANTAFAFDQAGNYLGAYDYYDKCLLNLDEVMSKFSQDDKHWQQLATLRHQYNQRMAQLKELELIYNRSNSVFHAITSSKSTSSSSSSSSNKKFSASQDEVYQLENFNDSNQFKFIPPPPSPIEIPIWQLSLIKQSIKSGGYITPTLFVPRQIWLQNDIKFSGLQIKIQSFYKIIKTIEEKIESLYLNADEDSLYLAAGSLTSSLIEFWDIQAQLSKSFPFIKELSQSTKNELVGDFNLFYNNKGRMSFNPDDYTASNIPQATAPSAPVSNSPSISSYIGSWGKSMKKAAEVGLHRLTVAMPSRVSSSELSEYLSIAIQMCETCQAITSWYKFALALKSSKLMLPSFPFLKPTSEDEENIGEDLSSVLSKEEQSALPPLSEKSLLYADIILQTIGCISCCLRDTSVEILLRDLENLLEKYLTRARKNFSRMYWDQDGQNQENS